MSFNLVINIDGQQYQTTALSNRLEEKGQECKVLNISAEDIIGNVNNNEINKEHKSAFNKLKNGAKIYVIGHGAAQSSYAGSLHFTTLADYISLGLKESPFNKETDHLKCSLIVCNAGTGDESKDIEDEKKIYSFAKKFHEFLGQHHNIATTVLARRQISMIQPYAETEGKQTMSNEGYGILNLAHKVGLSKLCDAIFEDPEPFHQTPRSKFSYKWDENGQQFAIDSYVDKFLSETKNLLNKLDNDHPEQQEKIQENLNIIEQFPNVTKEERLQLLSNLKSMSKTLNNEELNTLIKMGDKHFKYKKKPIERYNANIHNQYNQDTPDVFAKEKIIGPIRNELVKAFPKTNDVKEEHLREKLREFKRVGVQIAQQLSQEASILFCGDKNTELEQKTAVLIQLIIKIAAQNTFEEDEKLFLIDEAAADLAGLKPSEFDIIRRFGDILEAAEISGRHGPGHQIKSVIYFVESETAYAERTKETFNLIGSFIEMAQDPELLMLTKNYPKL